MILYVCNKCGPLAVLDVRGPFDMRITCRICGGFGIPVQQNQDFTKNEQIMNVCDLRGG